MSATLQLLEPMQATIHALTVLEATARRVKAKSANTQPVDALTVKLSTLFNKQGRHLVVALPPLRPYFAESNIDDDFNAIFDEATLETSADMQDTVTKAVRQVLLAGGKNLLKEFSVDFSFSLDNPKAAQYIANYGADFISGIDQKTKDDIRALLHAGIANGLSYNQVAASIKARYREYAIGQPQQHIRSRAHLIAITELGNAYQAGNFAAVSTLSDAGIALQKRWLTAGDKKVSDGCKANAAVGWISINDSFPSGHSYPLRFPGCRCVAQYRRAN